MAADLLVQRTGSSVDRDAICRFLEQVPLDHATLQFCERFDEQSRIWNFDSHSHPYFELIFFIEGKANIDAGAETVNVYGFDVVIYPPGLLHAEHLELGRRQEIICFWVDTGRTSTFDHAIKLMDERGTLRELFEMVYAEFTGIATPTATPGVLYIEETATITGGTGRFANATGSFSVERWYDTIAATTIGSFEGTISSR